MGIIIVLYLSIRHESKAAMSFYQANWAAIPDFYGTFEFELSRSGF